MKGIQFPTQLLWRITVLISVFIASTPLGCRNGSMSGIGDWARSLIGRGIRNKGVFPEASDRRAWLLGMLIRGVGEE